MAQPKVHHIGAALQGIADEHADILTPRQTEALYQAASKLWQPNEVRCGGCGSAWTDADLARERVANPRLLSCCPERKPLTIDQWKDRAERAEAALTAKDSELAEARAASDAAAYDLVAGWHERQAKLFREMADDEPRTAEPARKRATEAAIHHAASAAALRNRAITERRARTVLSREKEAGNADLS